MKIHLAPGPELTANMKIYLEPGIEFIANPTLHSGRGGITTQKLVRPYVKPVIMYGRNNEAIGFRAGLFDDDPNVAWRGLQSFLGIYMDPMTMQHEIYPMDRLDEFEHIVQDILLHKETGKNGDNTEPSQDGIGSQ